MSAGCARCGNCCDPVILESAIFAASGQRARSQDSPHDNDRFITQHWHPVGAYVDEGRTWLKLRCDMFDPVHRTCTAYDDRPPVCSRFPWYGHEPSGKVILDPQCSFLADLPPSERPPGARPLIPLRVVGAS